MGRKPPVGLVEKQEDLFRRTGRETAFFLSFFRRQHVIQFIVCLAIIFAHVAILPTPLFERFEYIVLDFFFRTRPQIAVHPAIAYIEIAEDSIQAIGRWPWPRHYHAVLTHLLTQWKAKAIVFDMLFSEPSTEFDDGALKEAIQESTRVYLPMVLEQKNREKIWIHSLSDFEQHAAGTGHINITPDRDGTLRRIEPYVSYGSEFYPHLALRVAYDYMGMPEKIVQFKDSGEKFLVNWAGKWDQAFEHYSYVDLIKSFEAVQSGSEPIIKPAQMEGKICLVGLTAFGHSDIKANSMEPAYPGVGVHANVINGILTRQFVRAAPQYVNMWFLIGIGLLASLLFVAFRNVAAFVGGLAVGLVWCIAAFVVFCRMSVWLYVIHPLILILVLFVFSTVFVLVVRNRERLQLFHLATRDGLTGLYVIRHFRHLLNQAAREAQKRKKSLSVILGDVDHFKLINDTSGHACGDMVLKGIARVIESAVAGPDIPKGDHIVARYGGEEIIVMLKNYNLQDAAFKMAEQIRKCVEQENFTWEGKRISVTISLGVATLRANESVPDLMVHRADEALYRAKEGGRNRVCVEEIREKNPPKSAA